MARVKKDHTGWRSSGIWKKDFGTTPEVAKHSSKKNVRKWCKGKVGKEHNFEFTKKSYFSAKFRIYKCINCGREEWKNYTP